MEIATIAGWLIMSVLGFVALTAYQLWSCEDGEDVGVYLAFNGASLVVVAAVSLVLLLQAV